MALPCHGRITWVQIPYDSFWLCGLKVGLVPFKNEMLCSSHARVIVLVVSLVKTSDCGSEDREFKSPLTPYAVNLMPKPIFWMHTKLRCVSSTLATALYSYNQFGD